MSGNRSISLKTLKELLAKSGNQCAFPNCTHPIINEKGVYIANLCHIEAVSEKGQRFNSDQSDSERNHFDNLMFLCYRHHKETDNVEEYSVEKMKEMKVLHEKQFSEAHFKNIDYVARQIKEYWDEIEKVNNESHYFDEFKIEIDKDSSHEELIFQIKNSLKTIEMFLSWMEPQDKKKYFELFELGVPNHMSLVNLRLNQLEIKYYEQLQLLNPDDKAIKEKLENLKETFKIDARNASVID